MPWDQTTHDSLVDLWIIRYSRVAIYRYCNMDQVVGMAFAEFDRIFKLS